MELYWFCPRRRSRDGRTIFVADADEPLLRRRPCHAFDFDSLSNLAEPRGAWNDAEITKVESRSSETIVGVHLADTVATGQTDSDRPRYGSLAVAATSRLRKLLKPRARSVLRGMIIICCRSKSKWCCSRVAAEDEEIDSGSAN